MQPDFRTFRTNPYLEDFLVSIGFLTRLPCDVADGNRNLASSGWIWPIVGALLGLVAGFAGFLLFRFGSGPAIAAIASLSILAVLTGALHEDGLADTCDGFWGGDTPERRLEIMRDSRIGVYGTLALCMTVLAKFSAVAAAPSAGTLVAFMAASCAISRASMLAALASLPSARQDGLAASFGLPSRGVVVSSCGIAAVVAVAATGLDGIFLIVAAAAGTFAMRQLTMSKVTGHTGDTLGATQQVVETLCLLTAAVLA